MLKHFLNPPNWFSSASLFCGLFSVVLATGAGGEQDFYRAGLMILFAGVFDMLDGRVARITGTGSAFGMQLDSLVDIVSFGVAPAVLLYSWGLDSLGWVGLVGAFAFALCAAFRLARFNTISDLKPAALGPGLTTTVAGATIAAAVMVHGKLGKVDVEHPVNVLLLSASLSFLMVSDVPYRTFKSLRLSRRTVISMALVVASMLVITLRWNAATMFLSVLSVLAASGPVELVGRKLLGLEYTHQELPPELAGPETDDAVEDEIEELS